MKTKKITLIVILTLLSAIIFGLLAHFAIAPALNEMNETFESLQTQSAIYEKDFEKVYSHPNYSIYPENNLTVVELKENGFSLKMYYMQDGTFVRNEIVDYDFYTNSFVIGFIWLLVALLSFMISLLITMLGIGMFGLYERRH